MACSNGLGLYLRRSSPVPRNDSRALLRLAQRSRVTMPNPKLWLALQMQIPNPWDVLSGILLLPPPPFVNLSLYHARMILARVDIMVSTSCTL